ncbi:MAG: protein RarD [Chloroflexi bacterium]|nr:MAG: protein RarD [Chloroflexota bacterium]
MKNKGILYGIAAYILWGLFPLYWKSMQGVPAIEILSHRMVWSFFFMLAVLAVTKRWAWIRPVLTQPKVLLTFLATAVLLGINWFTYIWGVNAGFIVETALGYFINPLVNVLLGFLFLKERLRRGQLMAVLLALTGVLYLTFTYGSLPWIALTLAFSFGFYGLLRKTAVLDSLEGLSLETAWLFPLALGMLIYFEMQGTAAFAHSPLTTNILLMGAGVVTAVPLLLFAASARRVTMATLGILQYLAPTCQFLIGVFIYGEAFSSTQLVGFSFIWVALASYSVESIRHSRKNAAKQTICTEL